MTTYFPSSRFYLFFYIPVSPFGLSSTDGPVDDVLYIHICRIYFTLLPYITFKAFYLRLPSPPPKLSLIICSSFWLSLAPLRCLDRFFSSLFRTAPPTPLTSPPICRGLLFRSVCAVKSAVALDICVFTFPAFLPNRSISDPQDTLSDLSLACFV